MQMFRTLQNVFYSGATSFSFLRTDRSPLCCWVLQITSRSCSPDAQSAQLPKASSGCCSASDSLDYVLRAQDKQPSPKSIPPVLGFTETMTLTEKG